MDDPKLNERIQQPPEVVAFIRREKKGGVMMSEKERVMEWEKKEEPRDDLQLPWEK